MYVALRTFLHNLLHMTSMILIGVVRLETVMSRPAHYPRLVKSSRGLKNGCHGKFIMKVIHKLINLSIH